MLEQSLYIEFDELFSLRERLRAVADQLRYQLAAAGLRERLEVEIYDGELEVRSAEGSNLLLRLDCFRLDVTGARPEIAIHKLATLILLEAEVFRLNSVELGITAWYEAGHRPLGLVAQAFAPVEPGGGEAMLNRRFAMTWDWSDATASYSFQASDTEDRELELSFKARETYMTLPELRAGDWVAAQIDHFGQLADRCLKQLGW